MLTGTTSDLRIAASLLILGGLAAAIPSPTRNRSRQPAQLPARPPVKPVESRIYFADYREVDGPQPPFRLRRAAGGETVEETIVDRYRINPKIDARRFEVRK